MKAEGWLRKIAVFSAILVTMLVIFNAFSYCEAKRIKYIPPATQSGIPEVEIENISTEEIKAWLSNKLVDGGYFLVNEQPQMLIYETSQTNMRFTEALAQELLLPKVTKAFSNNQSLVRISFNLIPLTEGSIRVLRRTYSVSSPGTPAERVFELTNNTRGWQQQGFEFLDRMKSALSRPVVRTTDLVNYRSGEQPPNP